MAARSFSWGRPAGNSKHFKTFATITALLSAGLVAWPVWTTNLLSSDFLPHRFCYLSNGRLIWLHFICDALIFVAYTTIAVVLAYLVYRARRDIPFHWVFLAFGTFIIACGFTHLMEMVVLWKAVYWLAGEVKLITAIASVLTAAVLPPLTPKMLAMVNSARRSEEYKHSLELANRELVALNARLRSLDALKSQFFANVSHELRTPLMLIELPAERVFSFAGLGPSERSDVALIQRNARRLRKQVDDLLDVARLEAGRMLVRYEQLDLAELVRLSASDFRGLADDRSLRFTVDSPQSLPAQADSEKISRIVLNLLSNAFKFTPSGGEIRCYLSAQDECAQLVVEDSGPGIPEEMRQAVFERFRQVEGGANRRFGGTGLGLAIVKDFVELLHGSVALDQSSLGGARFTITLPLEPLRPVVSLLETVPPDAATQNLARSSSVATQDATAEVNVAQRARAEIEALARSTAIESGKDAHAASAADARPDNAPLILIAEDSQELGRFLSDSLAGQYRVELAQDGATALRKARQLRPDLVITDIMMPGMSGDELIAELKSELDDMPIMVLTAKADDELRVDLLNQGAQDYLVKPFSLAEMQARIANLVSFKRIRDLLKQELQSSSRNVVELARDLAAHRRWVVTTLNSIADAVVATDNAGRVQFVNRAAELLLGKSIVEISGHPLRETVCLEDEATGAKVDDPEALVFSSDQPLTTRTHVLTPPGSDRRVTVEDSVAPIFDPDGKSQGLVMVLRDITDRRAAEEALQRSQRLAQAGRTAASVAHEINNPLAAITNLIFLTQSDPGLGPEARRYLGMANQEVVRIAHLTKQTLGFYRDSNPPSGFNVAATIDSVLAIYSFRIGSSGVELIKQLDSEAQAFGSSQEFRQVFANLLLNALDAMAKRGGRLLIRSRRRRSRTGDASEGVQLTIADTGKGISDESKGKIFEPFYTTKATVGMGLGLWLSRELVQKHRGTIRMRSRAGAGQSGTVFSIFWPSEPLQNQSQPAP
jgi:PAS domain S-box-containing protein